MFFDCSCVLHSLSNTLGQEGAISCSLIVRVFYIHFLVHWDKRERFLFFDCSCVLHSLSSTLGQEGAISCSLIVHVFYIHFLIHWDKRGRFLVL